MLLCLSIELWRTFSIFQPVKKVKSVEEGVPFQYLVRKGSVDLLFEPALRGKIVTLYHKNRELGSYQVDEKGKIKISRRSKLSKKIIEYLRKGELRASL